MLISENDALLSIKRALSNVEHEYLVELRVYCEIEKGKDESLKRLLNKQSKQIKRGFENIRTCYHCIHSEERPYDNFGKECYPALKERALYCTNEHVWNGEGRDNSFGWEVPYDDTLSCECYEFEKGKK